MTEPPDDALPLLEAFQRFSERYAVELVGDRPAFRWIPQAKDARSRATSPFFERLNKGELRWWGRHNEVSGPWVELQGRDAPIVQVGSWRHAILQRVESRPVERSSIAPTYLGRRDGQSWLPVRRHASSGLYVAEKWFDVRVALAVQIIPKDARTIPEAEIEKWLRKNRDLSEDDGWPAARLELNGNIPRARFRAVRDKLGIKLDRGRRS